MTDKTKYVEKYAIKKLSALDAHGFSLPTAKREKWSTTVSSLSSDIAIELELDWRELDVFVLVTALSDGRLPGGYYVSEGKKCRIHLEDVLKDRCGISDADIQSFLKNQPSRSERDETTMKSRLDDYMRLVEQHISVIKEHGLRVFE